MKLYLGGANKSEWREKVKQSLDFDKVYDAFEADFVPTPNKVTDVIAFKMLALESADMCIFHLDESCGISAVLEMAEAIGREIPVVVYVNGFEKAEIIKWYCGFRGIEVVHSLDDLIEITREYIDQQEKSYL